MDGNQTCRSHCILSAGPVVIVYGSAAQTEAENELMANRARYIAVSETTQILPHIIVLKSSAAYPGVFTAFLHCASSKKVTLSLVVLLPTNRTTRTIKDGLPTHW
jgi:hypothetical protein